jgi:hypothetical protein
MNMRNITPKLKYFGVSRDFWDDLMFNVQQYDYTAEQDKVSVLEINYQSFKKIWPCYFFRKIIWKTIVHTKVLKMLNVVKSAILARDFVNDHDSKNHQKLNQHRL